MKVLKVMIVSFFVVVPQFVFAVSGKSIMQRVKDRPDGYDRKSVMKMVLINSDGNKRIRVIRSKSKEYGKVKKSLMVFSSPAGIRGTAFLQYDYDSPKRDDDRWLYMPALRRSRRISGSSKNKSFMGSDFTYDDMGKRSIKEDVHSLIKEELLNGYACWVISSAPKEGDSSYSKVISWIRKDILMAIQVKYYDREGAMLKKMRLEKIEKIDGFWTAKNLIMHNVQENHKTLLILSKVRYNLGLRASCFWKSRLGSGGF